MKRLLIFSCSRRRTCDPNPLPAIETYDSPTFRVLRRFMQQPSNAVAPGVDILPSEFGLTAHRKLVSDYNRRMIQLPARANCSAVVLTPHGNTIKYLHPQTAAKSQDLNPAQLSD